MTELVQPSMEITYITNGRATYDFMAFLAALVAFSAETEARVTVIDGGPP